MKSSFAKLCFLLMLITLSICHPPPAVAQSVKFDDFRIVKRSLAVGKATSVKAAPCAWVEVADTGSNRGVLLSGTDTAKIAYPRKPGLLIYSRRDSALVIWNGVRWRKTTLTNL